MTPEAIETKYGVAAGPLPRQGRPGRESSDNLPGVPGVGDKTAAKWINQYGGLDGVIAHVDEIKGKAGDSLRAHLADVMRNYELNSLVCDLELPLTPQDVRGTAGTARRCTRSSTRWSSGSCGSGSTQYLDAVEPEAESGFDLAGTVLAPGAVAGWLREHAGTGAGRCAPSPAPSAAAPAR